VIQNNHQFYLVPVQHPYEYMNEENLEYGCQAIESPRRLPEVKVELDDDVSEELEEEICEDRKDGLVLSSDQSTSDSENLHPYSCLHCRKSFKRNYNLERHMSVHDNPIAYPYKCPNCDRRFKVEQSFKFHISLHEGGREMFHCADCDFKSRKAATVKRHQIRRHANIYGFRCHLCAKIFKNETTFLEHMKVHGTAICNVCDFTCKDDYHLAQHKLEHRDDQDDESCKYEQLGCREKYQVNVKCNTKEECKPEKIDLQQYSNKSLDELDRDLNLLKGKRYLKCPQCKWRFGTAKLLKKHLKRHSQSFKCDQCDAVFKYKASFLKHKYKHEHEC